MRITACVLALLSLPATACTVDDITIKSTRARFVDEGLGRDYIRLRGIAVLTNRCKEAIGVQIKVTGYDQSGAPVTTKDGWPASIRNIPPGDYEFSLDGWIRYDPSIKTFRVTPIEVKRWR